MPPISVSSPPVSNVSPHVVSSSSSVSSPFSQSPSFSVLPLIPTHSMITRGKNGISVPKIHFSLLTQTPPLTEPLSFKEAMTFPEWRQAMSEEYREGKETGGEVGILVEELVTDIGKVEGMTK